MRLVLAALALLLLVACPEKPRSPPPNRALEAQIDSLESRVFTVVSVLTSNEDPDNCRHSFQQARRAGGIIYVDHLGHCTFVRPLPRMR